MRAATQTDIAILNSGSLRSDCVHPTGPFKMKVSVEFFIESESYDYNSRTISLSSVQSR